jgi:rSAM/selenodomain-associated transferase 2
MTRPPGMTPELAVVIPTLDEAGALPVLLDQLRRQERVALEVIVADGGSRDATIELARRYGARVVEAPRGRGAQMNAGARASVAPHLLFLHADTELTAAGQLRQALDALPQQHAGHFALRFARRSLGNGWFYRYLEEKSASGRAGTINGDQGLLIGRAFFDELGGYDERLPFLEDQRIAAKIFERGRWTLLPGKLLTSARRFEKEGPHRRYTVMSLIMGMHAAGADEFFALAPKVYAVQAETGRLRVGAYLALTWRVLIAAGWRRALTILWRAGRYSRQNAWQVFFWCDVALRLRSRPLLRLYDRVLQPVTNNFVFDALGMALMSAWFLVALPVFYRATDR